MASTALPLAPPPSTPPSLPPSPPDDEFGGASIVLGVFLALGAAAGIGLAMVIQRLGLSRPNERVNWKCCQLSSQMTWFLGLVLYGAANGLQAASLTLGPLFLLGGIFTLLLVFNIFFARLILDEEVTRRKYLGAIVMILGVTLAVVSSPEDVQTEFSGDEIEALMRNARGSFWLILLFGSLFATIAVMVLFERQYPAAQHDSPGGGTPRAPMTDSMPAPKLPSATLNNIMAVVYPMSVRPLRREGGAEGA